MRKSCIPTGMSRAALGRKLALAGNKCCRVCHIRVLMSWRRGRPAVHGVGPLSGGHHEQYAPEFGKLKPKTPFVFDTLS